jgi:serine/threonine protein phosphatase PrpC
MCGMQMFMIYLGWRRYMEDAHLAVSLLSDGKLSLFAVFDGHGGILKQLF